jgi:hypothetical protein
VSYAPAPVRPAAPSDRRRSLAQRIERPAVAGRVDPEAIVVEKLDIARALHRVAQELER